MQCFMCNKNQKTMIKFMATQKKNPTKPKIDGLVVHLSFGKVRGIEKEDTRPLNGHYWTHHGSL